MASIIRNALAVVAYLVNDARIPSNVANSIAKEFSVTDLRDIVTNNLLDKLMQIPGVGEKRAAACVKALTGHIPEKLDSSRKTKTMPSRTKAEGFSLYCFPQKAVLSDYEPYRYELEGYKFDKKTAETAEGQKELMAKRRAFDELVKFAWHFRNDPIVMSKNAAKINRMTYSMAALIYGIDCSDRKPKTQLITVEHNVQEAFNFNWHVAGTNEAQARKRIDTLTKVILRRIGAGVEIHSKQKIDNQWIIEKTMYEGFAASAAHQKDEKLIMAKKELMHLHEKAIYFGLTKEEFLKLKLNGAAIWKMRANLLRPLRVKLTTKDGHEVLLDDIELVPDIKAMRHYDRARRIGTMQNNGDIFVDGPADEERTIWDGGASYEVEMNFEGQLTSLLVKAMGQDGRSSNETAAKLLGVPVKHSDKLIMMGEGCWKGDKLGLTWDEYVSRMRDLSVTYPGINNIWLLREADEPEDTTRIRRLTRSLIQQWIYMDPEDIRAISRKARRALKKLKTVRGALKMLAKSNIEDSERTVVEKLFNEAPWLVMCPNVQLYLKTRYEERQKEAAGNKFITEGSYPYITEDLVAIYQINRYGCDPNSKDLGVLKEGEMSVPGVINGAKVLAVRFPANFQTAKVMKNVSCKDAFATMGNIAVISIYDDILVRQDGDVDGDEMAIILNKIAIKYTESMMNEFDPPVVLFEHGAKAKFEPLATEERMLDTMYEDLWKAKKFDGVGKYANLATLCAHLASIAYQDGNKEKTRMHLIQMSLASTGAILAIDQVKGNEVSEELVERLEEIGKLVRKECNYMMPYTQQFIKGVPANECNEETNALCDQNAALVMRDTGAYSLDTGTMLWNKVEAKRVLTTTENTKVTSVRQTVVSGTILNALADNWFNDNDNADDRKTFEAMKRGEPIGIKELSLLLWRNACALEFRMEGENLVAKREEYRKTVKSILFQFATTGKWEANGYVFTTEDKKASVVNALVSNALGLVGDNNGIEYSKRGHYAMFILKVFAEELLDNVRKNKVNLGLFEFDFESVDDIVSDEIIDEVKEILFSSDVAVKEMASDDEDQPVWFSDYDDME